MHAQERNTRQKQAVYQALCALGHPSATEVYEYVRRENPTISRGTVFRVLAAFAEGGRANRLCLHESDIRYDATLTPHAHAVCRRCGKITDVPFSEQQLPSLPDFTAERCEVEFRGLCSTCKNEIF